MNNILFDPIELGNERFDIGTDSIQTPKIESIYKGLQIGSNKWIELACELANDSVKNGSGPFGAVILQIDDESKNIIRYWRSINQVTRLKDPTAHAEINAIRSACKSLNVFNLGSIQKKESSLPQTGNTSHCEIFSSCEPCPMCYSAIFWARIPTFYFAATRFDASQQGVAFSDKELYDELAAPYIERKTKVFQCITRNSLDAFQLWKNSDKMEY